MPILPISALIAANLVPVFGVLFFGWNASSILFLYWFENIVIGVYNVVKMATVNNTQIETDTRKAGEEGTKGVAIPFFIVHYGLFTLGHGVFLFALFIHDLVRDTSLYVAIAALFMSHGISLITNYWGNKENQRTSLNSLMVAPYARVFVMHATILLSMGFVAATGHNIYALLVLVGIKLVIDLYGHIKEHTKRQTYVLTSSQVPQGLTIRYEQIHQP